MWIHKRSGTEISNEEWEDLHYTDQDQFDKVE